MRPQLGLVCITQSKEVRYRMVTRKRLLELAPDGQRKLLDEIYRDNIQTFDKAVRYCERESISLYRILSSIFPFADEDVGAKRCGRWAMRWPTPGVTRWNAASAWSCIPISSSSSVRTRQASSPTASRSCRCHADIMDLLQQPRSPWALLEIHGGKAGRADALVERIAALPDAIRLRLGLENDEYAYSAAEIHDICLRSGVPMVFDAHHHIVHERLPSYDDPSVAEMLAKARATWADPAQQLVHISNGRDGFNDRQHADLIDVMPACYAKAPYIEIEAKFKEEAIRKLRGWQSGTAGTAA